MFSIYFWKNLVSDIVGKCCLWCSCLGIFWEVWDQKLQVDNWYLLLVKSFVYFVNNGLTDRLKKDGFLSSFYDGRWSYDFLAVVSDRIIWAFIMCGIVWVALRDMPKFFKRFEIVVFFTNLKLKSAIYQIFIFHFFFFENYKKYFLFHRKSSFCSPDIQIFVICSFPFHTFQVQKDKWKWNNLWCHELACINLQM